MPKLTSFSEYGPETDAWTDAIFSSDGGFVWASWPGTEASVKLGKHQAVSAMMQDFLAQNALGQRLTRTADV